MRMHAKTNEIRKFILDGYHIDNLYFLGIRKEMFYLTTHSTRFIYGYMA